MKNERNKEMQLTTKKMALNQLKEIYKMIEQDFANGEYPPYNILYRQLKSGCIEGFLLYEENNMAAYAICTRSRKNDYVLISLLAVCSTMRGRGLGTAFLDMLKSRYSHINGLIVEVEKPDEADSGEEEKKRNSRIRFYHRAGFLLLPGIEYSIWDVPLYLMVLPIKAAEQEINLGIETIMFRIYLELLGQSYIHKLKIKRPIQK